MMKKAGINFLALCVSGFLGGAVMTYAMQVSDSHAVQELLKWSTYRDDSGKQRIALGVVENQVQQNFFGEDGTQRIQFGTYGTGAEAGQPFAGLFDRGGKLRLLMRLHSEQDSPVFIMKDKTGNDRIVFGLSFDENQEPFFAYFKKDGTKEVLFGNY